MPGRPACRFSCVYCMNSSNIFILQATRLCANSHPHLLSTKGRTLEPSAERADHSTARVDLESSADVCRGARRMADELSAIVDLGGRLHRLPGRLRAWHTDRLGQRQGTPAPGA